MFVGSKDVLEVEIKLIEVEVVEVEEEKGIKGLKSCSW